MPEELAPYVRQGRLAMGCVHSHDLRRAIRIYAVYGYASYPEATAELLEKLSAFAAEHGHCPSVLAGDLNVTTDCGYIEALLSAGFWRSLIPQDHAYEESSCHTHHGEATRIDHIWGIVGSPRETLEGGLIEDTGTRPHNALWASVSRSAERLSKVQLPKTLSGLA